MKRVITFLAIISIVLSLGLIYVVDRAKVMGDTEFYKYSSDPVIVGKRFGGSFPIRYWAQPNDDSVKELAQKLKSKSDLITTINVFNWYEESYIYTTDNMAITNHGEEVISGTDDTWLLPSEVIEMKKQKGVIKADCEDSAVIVSILESAGVEAYMNIGIIRITDLTTGQVSNYGHGFPSVIIDGKEYILESTIGQKISELKSGTVFFNKDKTMKVEYIPYIKFNSQRVIPVNFGADVNDIPDPLPPAKVQDLKNLLNSQS
jgi:hypothetical protein